MSVLSGVLFGGGIFLGALAVAIWKRSLSQEGASFSATLGTVLWGVGILGALAFLPALRVIFGPLGLGMLLGAVLSLLSKQKT